MVLLSLWALTIGSVKIPISDIKDILTGVNINKALRSIILDVRLPRIIMSLLIGMMLASTGTVVQAVFKNPLADPYIVGISASATAGAVVAYLFQLPDIFYGLFAFITAIITTFVIFKMANSKGRMETSSLLIIGIAVSAFLGSFTSFAMYLMGEESYRIMMWTMGFLGGATWFKVLLLTVPLVLSLLFFFFHRHSLDAIMMGEEQAHSLGIPVPRLKKQLLTVSAFVVAFSVAFTGLIGFVGLIVPHTLRMIVGYSNSKLIPSSAVFGGIFLLLADTLARRVMAPGEIPIGIITAFFGAPFFLYLAVKAKKRGDIL